MKCIMALNCKDSENKAQPNRGPSDIHCSHGLTLSNNYLTEQAEYTESVLIYIQVL